MRHVLGSRPRDGTLVSSPRVPDSMCDNADDDRDELKSLTTGATWLDEVLDELLDDLDGVDEVDDIPPMEELLDEDEEGKPLSELVVEERRRR